VQDAQQIDVTLQDGREYSARVIGHDEKTDVALIKIDAAADLPTAPLGNSDRVRVGEWVMAIGNPFGFDHSVTAGIVSAKDRPSSQFSNLNTQFQRFLQTDAAINPGNSGGPLVDMAGQVIGINTAILTGSRSTGNEGVGFALPSNIAINIYNQLVQTGHVVRGSIGVRFDERESMNPVVLHSLGAENGVVVGYVVPDGPADKAGLKVGDVLTKVNGKAVHNSNDLVDPIIQTPVGNKVRLSYIRSKQEREVTIAVEAMSKLFPETAQNGDDEGNSPSDALAAPYGIHAEELTPEIAKGLHITSKGGVILARDPDAASFGDDINLTHRDVITEINGQPINNLADFKKAIAALKPGQEVVFKVLRPSESGPLFTALLGGVVPSSNK
jgi:serine protease Do